jgi:hypothetical protein
VLSLSASLDMIQSKNVYTICAFASIGMFNASLLAVDDGNPGKKKKKKKRLCDHG